MSIGYIKQSGASVPTPPPGEMNTFVDSADDHYKRKDSTGAIVDIEAVASGVSSFNGRSGAVLPQSGDYDAGEISFTPTGTIVATDVQSAIDFLDTSKAPETHVGSNGASQHAIADGSNAGFMSPSNFTKLAGIATGATANQTDAFLLNRANHTGTQSVGTITGLATVATTGSYADLTSTPSSLPPNGAASGDLTGSYPAPTLSAAIQSFLLSRSNHTGTQSVGTITGLATVATTGSYVDLTSTPSALPPNGAASGDLTGSYPAPTLSAAIKSFLESRSNHTGTQSAATITGLATVATTGSYADLTATPSALPPNGAASGDLTGSYPAPTLSGAIKSFLESRANHTGTQLAATISDFSTAANAAVTPGGIGAQPHDTDLDALAGLSTNGIIVRTGSGTADVRTIQPGTGISISNGNGVSADPIISSTITQYTDELAQDAIGAALLATASIQPTYNDPANQFSWAVLPAGVDHNSLLNFVATKHIDHSGVTISGLTNGGLGGGGDITASRTLNIDWTNLPTLALPTTRMDFTDLFAVYDTPTTTHKSLNWKDLISQVGSFVNRAYSINEDFHIDGNGRLLDVGAGTGASVQSGTYGIGTSANALGVSQLDTGTTATGRRTLSTGLSSLVTTKARMRLGVRFALEQLSSVTQTFTSYIGFIDNSATGDMGNGAYFKYTDGVNAGKWQCVTAQGSTRTANDSGITADTNYHAFTIEMNEAGTSVAFYIDGVLVQTITTNIPNGTLAQAFGYGWKMEKSVGTTQVNQSVDWYYYEQERTNAR